MQTAERGRFTWFEVDGNASNNPALIALAAGPGFSHKTLRPWLQGLSAERQVVSLDLPGVGRGSKEDGQDYGYESYVNDLDHVRRAAELGRIILLGHGWGASVAVEYTLAHPGHVAALILVSPIRIFGADGQNGPAQQRMVEAIDPSLYPRFTQDVWPLFEAGLGGSGPWEPVEAHPWWGEMIRTQFASTPPQEWDDALSGQDWSLRAYATYKGAAMSDPSHAMARYDLAERVAKMPKGIPLLVVSSEHDANYVATASLHADPILEAYPGAESIRFDSAGHFPFVERTEEFEAAVRDFLERRTSS